MFRPSETAFGSSKRTSGESGGVPLLRLGRYPARRVAAKVEFHFAELFPQVGFIVTNLALPSRVVVRFYSMHGTADQWIKEGKLAVNWTRLSCHRFRGNRSQSPRFGNSSGETINAFSRSPCVLRLTALTSRRLSANHMKLEPAAPPKFAFARGLCTAKAGVPAYSLPSEGPGWMPSPRTKAEPTPPTTAALRGSFRRSRM